MQRVPADDHAGGVIAFESAHRSEPCLEPYVVGFDPIVRVLLGVVKRGRDQLLDHRAERRRAVRCNSTGSPCPSAVSKNRRAALVSRWAETYTSWRKIHAQRAAIGCVAAPQPARDDGSSVDVDRECGAVLGSR